MAGRQVASHLDLTQNSDPASPPSGLTRIKAKVDGDVVVVTPDGQEKSIVNVAASVQSVNGDTGEVRVHSIESPSGAVTPTSVVASDNAIAFNFNGQDKAVYRAGGVDFFSNMAAPYSYRFRDADGSHYAGLRAPSVVDENYFSMLPSSIGQVGQVLSVNAVGGNNQSLGYVTPSHPIDLYNSIGLISKNTRIKQFVAVVQSDANGDFTVDWSAAGFTQPPFSVTATALGPVTATVRDRVWATMRSDITTTQGRGYTLRGRLIVSILVGGAETIITAPNVAVHVVAWGI